MKKFVLAFGFLGILGASMLGCGGPDNVGACKNYVTTVNELTCLGDIKIEESTCDAYANTSCDIADYFDCLSSKYACDGDTLDQEKFGSISECNDLATCN